MQNILNPAGSKRLALTIATQTLSNALVSKTFYLVLANQDLYLKQGTGAQVASATDGNAFVPARTPVVLDGANGDNVAVIGLVAGDVTITPITYFLR